MRTSDPFAPLLSTKLYIPRRQPLSQRNTFVSRPHLLVRLTAGLSGKLTLIAAPAGFGKSTLLSEWIDEPASEPQTGATRAARPSFCWLSLEESDNDPIRFWLYFIAALQTMHPGLSADTPALLQSPEPPPIETILTILLNDLSAWPATQTPAIVLILEDYHVITTPAIHHGLTFFLEHLPPTLHLVMTTRADPPLPLARLRTRGELSEFRADDLRFTHTETALFVNERMGLQLSPEQVQLLAVRTEGWIVGLQLAALSMQEYSDKAEFLHSFSGGHRYILNYLIEEVLNQQPKAIQEFLLRTSILTRLCGPLCDAVISGEAAEAGMDALAPFPRQSQAILEQIAQANLFLIRLDDRGQWYRYHQLFAEVLQYRLRQSQPTILPMLHRCASLWYAHHDYLADAIHHALLGADFTTAAALIDQVWPTLWNQGAIATLFTWMQALPVSNPPEAKLWGQPGLYVSYAWGLALTGQIEAAEVPLRQVEAILQAAGLAATAAPLNILLGRAAALRALLVTRRGVPAAAIVLAEQALTVLPPDVPVRGDAYYALGLAQQQQGLLKEAFEAYEAAATVSVSVNDNFLSVTARYHEARILMAQGELQKAATLYQQMLALPAHAKKQLPVVRLAHIGYGEVLYQWNELPAATRHVDTGLALSPRHDVTYTDGPFHRFSILARLRQAVGDRAGALAAVSLAKETAAQTGIALDVERAAALDALIQLRLDEITDAAQWAATYARLPNDTARFTYLHEFETLVFVRILLAQSRAKEALTLLAEWLPLVESAQRQGTLIELYLLQALALEIDDQAPQARQTLLQALVLAEPEGYIRLFVDEGEPMRFLLTAVDHWLAEQVSTDAIVTLMAYVHRLRKAFAPHPPLLEAVDTPGSEKSQPATAAKPQPLLEPLTDRERAVLALIAAGLSNAAIAEELVVSVGTVKTHLKHIYGKLAVQSRTQAVAKARALDLM